MSEQTPNKIQTSFLSKIKNVFAKKEAQMPDPVYETLGDIINNEAQATDENDPHQQRLIANVLSVSTLTAEDVMIPRADIVAIDMDASSQDLLTLLTEKTYSRIPVYQEKLDDIVGCVNSKDVLVYLSRGELPVIKDMLREVMIVSPSLDALDLLLAMRESRKHMALVVDEFGGIDGLITIGDMIEAIVGEIEDEDDSEEEPKIIPQSDGTIIVGARVNVTDFEDEYGQFLTPEEREDVDTMGGLMMAIAGRMPTRGEILTHQTGLEVEIVEADARRIKKLRIHKLPNIQIDNE